MHYNVADFRGAAPPEEIDAAAQNPTCGSSPAGVEQRDRTLLSISEVDRNTVGDGDGEQKAVVAGGVTIDAVEEEPSVRQRFVPLDFDPVHLMREHDRRKPGAERGAECPPPPDHLADGLIAPQAETQRAGRDPGHDPVPLGPFRQLEPRDGGIAGGDFGERMGGW